MKVVVLAMVAPTEINRSRQYREAQMALAHANRVATMGQLTASITHEVNQPITAAVTNAVRTRPYGVLSSIKSSYNSVG